MLGHGLAASTMTAAIQHVSASVATFEVAFFRNLFGFLALVPLMIRGGILESLKTRRFGMHLLRAGLNLAAMLTFFGALAVSPLAEVAALSFCTPLFATLLAVLVLGEKIGVRRTAALLVGLLGALLILRPGFVPISFGNILTLASSFLWAWALMVIKIMGRTESSLTMTAWASILLTFGSFPLALMVWSWPTAETFAFLILIGVSGSTAQMLVAQAFRLAPASALMPIDFSKLVFSTLFGWLFFAQVPDALTLLGGSVIFSAVLYVAARERLLGQPATPRDGNGG